MKNSDIAKVAGLSHSSIIKILYLKDKSTHKFRKETVDKVLWLKSIENYLEAKFKSKAFITLCDNVLEKINRRDTKRYIEIMELARCCKLLGSKKNHGIVRSLYYNAYDVFLDDDFYSLCMMGISKSNNITIREDAFELAELSRTFRKKLRLK